MTGTFPGPVHEPGNASADGPAAIRPTRRERAVVLGGFAAAALYSAVSAATGTGMETAGAVWLAAIAWAVVSSLALALRRGLRDRDWRAFRRHRLPDNGELIDWTTQSGEYAWVPVAEEHERLMRGD